MLYTYLFSTAIFMLTVLLRACILQTVIAELANCKPPPLPRPRCTRLSTFFHPYSVHLSNARVNQYLHSFIPYTVHSRNVFLCLFFQLPMT